MKKTRIASPSASSMIESLRGLGYSLPTALADIIDNSITAGAKTVDIFFIWEDTRRAIAIHDDGCGMSTEGLFNAMRLGFLSPLTERTAYDLGRFGFGLKTASFSQCRCLTVFSKRQDTTVSSFCWDIDYLTDSADGEWHLLEEPGKEAFTLCSLLDKFPQGTLVVLEKLDRIITCGFTKQDYLELIAEVEKHLALTFHRFIETSNPRIVLTINGTKIKAYDPFMQGHPSTWNSPIENFSTVYGNICIQGHVLPHKDKLSLREYEETGGPNGWTDHQGFYVYRNERLIVAGNWLNLASGRVWTKEEAHRLARIRLDIPNTADTAWKLDIRKSVALPPVILRKRLIQFAETVRKRARQVFAHRGEYKKDASGKEISLPIWHVENVGDDVRYRIDREHPAVLALCLNDKLQEEAVHALLFLIEKTVPVQRIWLDAAEGKDAPQNAGQSTPPDEMLSILKIVYKNLIYRTNISSEEAKVQLKRMEPFNMFPDLVDSLSNLLDNEME